MAFLAVYLARTARRDNQTAVSATRNTLQRFGALLRAVAETWSEARDMRRTMTNKYPFTDA